MAKKFVPNAMLLTLAAVSILLTGAITISVLARHQPTATDAAPPVFYDVPAFELIDQNEQPFGSDDLKGKVWVADFMFTRCSGICPMLSANMKALQDELKTKPYWDRVRLVSISVDEEHDTPAILREYAERFDAEPGHWVFLTGPRERVWPLIEDGFKLVVGEAADNAAMPFDHSGKFALVDARGRVRAYHDGTDPASRAALIADLETLLVEQK